MLLCLEVISDSRSTIVIILLMAFKKNLVKTLEKTLQNNRLKKLVKKTDEKLAKNNPSKVKPKGKPPVKQTALKFKSPALPKVKEQKLSEAIVERVENEMSGTESYISITSSEETPPNARQTSVPFAKLPEEVKVDVPKPVAQVKK